MKLLLLPFMMCIELFLLFAVFIIGIIRPSLGLDLCDWFSAHLPSRDWYWGLKMDVSPCLPAQRQRSPGGPCTKSTNLRI